MKDGTVKLGTTEVKASGNAAVVKLPIEWLASHELQVGDPLFTVLTIDKVIRVHLTPVEWSKRAKVRRAAQRGAAYVTLSAPHVRKLGWVTGTKLRLRADEEHKILLIDKA